MDNARAKKDRPAGAKHEAKNGERRGVPGMVQRASMQTNGLIKQRRLSTYRKVL